MTDPPRLSDAKKAVEPTFPCPDNPRLYRVLQFGPEFGEEVVSIERAYILPGPPAYFSAVCGDYRSHDFSGDSEEAAIDSALADLWLAITLDSRRQVYEADVSRRVMAYLEEAS